jgi:hypothetical protein
MPLWYIYYESQKSSPLKKKKEIEKIFIFNSYARLSTVTRLMENLLSKSCEQTFMKSPMSLLHSRKIF